MAGGRDFLARLAAPHDQVVVGRQGDDHHPAANVEKMSEEGVASVIAVVQFDCAKSV